MPKDRIGQVGVEAVAENQHHVGGVERGEVTLGPPQLCHLLGEEPVAAEEEGLWPKRTSAGNCLAYLVFSLVPKCSRNESYVLMSLYCITKNSPWVCSFEVKQYASPRLQQNVSFRTASSSGKLELQGSKQRT